MRTFLAGTGIIALWCVITSAIAWLLSTLVTFLFGVDFGFWQAFAVVILIRVISELAFSGLNRRSTQ